MNGNMNTKYVVASFVLLALVAGPVVSVRANDDEAHVGVKGSVRANIWNNREEKQHEEWQEQREDWQEARDKWQHAGPGERLKMRQNLSFVFKTRMGFAGEGLQHLHDRIETWLEKARDEKDIDGTAAANFLASAQVDINAIKDKSAKIEVILDSEVAEDEKDEKKEEIKTLWKEIRALIVSAHEDLKSAVRSIKSEVHASAEVEAGDDNDDDNDDDN